MERANPLARPWQQLKVVAHVAARPRHLGKRQAIMWKDDEADDMGGKSPRFQGCVLDGSEPDMEVRDAGPSALRPCAALARQGDLRRVPVTFPRPTPHAITPRCPGPLAPSLLPRSSHPKR